MPPDEGSSSTLELCTAVQKISQSFLALSELFESRFGDLVTAGRASEYPPLVDEFKLLFAAASGNLARIDAVLRAGLDGRNHKHVSVIFSFPPHTWKTQTQTPGPP